MLTKEQIQRRCRIMADSLRFLAKKSVKFGSDPGPVMTGDGSAHFIAAGPDGQRFRVTITPEE